MKKQNLLTKLFRLHQKSGNRNSTKQTRNRELKQEAQYSLQLPVSVPKSQREYWDGLSERKRKEAGISDTEVISS